MNQNINDWDLTDDFYNDTDNTKEFKLEDFQVEDTSSFSEASFEHSTNTEFLKTVDDVKKCRIAMENGKSIKEICSMYGFSEEYAYTISMTLSGAREDNNDEAVARLINI